MIRRTSLALCILLLLVTASPATLFADKVQAKKKTNETAAKVQEMVDKMSTEEKVGQLFIVHVYGKTPTDENYERINIDNHRGGKNFKEVIEKYHVGGVIYFNWTDNITTPLDAAQVNGLSNGIQEIAMEDNGIPLFVSTDQEGGIVQRVVAPGTVFPGNMALGATQSKTLAANSGRVLGNELKSLGINMDFAPTLDVNINPDNPVIGVRSYGENPDMVSRLGIAQINAFQEENVIATAKHFPGHGDTDTDSHTALPIIHHDLETLYEIDLKPFKAAIENGIDAIMTAHIVVPALDDSGLPATLSKPILTDLLRNEMGFDGLIITDSLGMSGANVVPEDRVAVEAFKAGADILLNPPKVAVAYNGMMDAIESGEISEERLDASVSRILTKKMEAGLFQDPYTPLEAIDSIGSEGHLQTAAAIADKSVTLVKNNENVLPLDDSKNLLVTGPSAAKPELLAEFLSDKKMHVDAFATGTSPTKEEIEHAVAKAENADMIIATTYSANTNEKQQELVAALQDTDKKVIVAGMRNPYDVMTFADVDAFLNTYSYMDVSVKALSKVLVGEINPSGKLPVNIPDLYTIGHGLDYIGDIKSAKNVRTLVNDFSTSGDIKQATARKLTIHLQSIERFEQTKQPDKVIKHLKGFQQLIEHASGDGSLSDKAFSYLDAATKKLQDRWID
ncbi:glycoside hydrolase family 3 protein [Virgibacillus sp. 179-BFC.A HS]|uniref:beta-N-acetylhexosaminidase n=1 Tax=Tigheibacillus jepli TaxID=3035914 RepID=A0ABU5CJ70_9BACI|nr:glycoside hydrolase family 3 protein [Virgibacillus sp. 179-BFC.A HS]MDY0406402.1 glycoside hydrolase family 3 protein [Virgibacillus sp. 179-BFC.A HS]